MIDGVLQYATVDVSEQFVHEIDLSSLVKSIVEDLEIPIKEHNAKIEYTDLPVLKGYPTLVNQLLYNLINNSLKFRKPNISPCIRIYTQQLDEAEQKAVQGNFFKLVLEDNGVGFDQSYAEKIFESFTRLHPKDKFEGTGLGLALCRKIVLRHKGIIKASGELDKGAKFTIFFPQAIRVFKTVGP